MNKEAVLAKLITTLKHLEELDPKKFKYSDTVSRYDLNHDCGTVCCVYGWYPKWYPKSNFKWEKNFSGIISLETKSDSHVLELVKFHSLNGQLIDVLFFGIIRKLNVNTKNVPNKRYLMLGLTKGLESKLPEVIEMFKHVINLIEKDIVLWK